MTQPLLTFIHISDTHIHADANYTHSLADATSYNGAVALVRQINALPFTPDFVLHTGDVAYDPIPEAYAMCKAILNDIRFPVYYAAGNHDESLALQTFVLGYKEMVVPLHYEFEVNGVQIVVVDSNGGAAVPRGLMTEAQLSWLAGICNSNDSRPLIVATHHNPQLGFIPWLDNFMGIQNTEAFHQTLLPARHRLRGVFFGHVHQNLDIYRDGILYSSTLSSWMQFHSYPGLTETSVDRHAEPGFSIVTVTPTQTFIRRCRFDIPR